MNGFEAILLGIVQGLTEFLPISSSGHLIIVPWLLDISYLQENPEFNKTFDVALHLGTLLAVVSYFRTEVGMMITGTVSVLRHRRVQTEAEKLAIIVLVGTIPAVVVGGLFEKTIERELGQPWQIAILIIAFGLLLGYADRRPTTRHFDEIGHPQALFVGIAQALALIPGVSRSGITITAGRFLGLNRDAAARFGFFLLVPVTFGAVVFKGIGVATEGLPAGSTLPIVLGVLSAAVSGYLAIASMLKLVRHHTYDIFVVYRVFVGVAIAIVIITGLKSPDFEVPNNGNARPTNPQVAGIGRE
jgi:undecaprenyl-diphosphatase